MIINENNLKKQIIVSDVMCASTIIYKEPLEYFYIWHFDRRV